MDKTLTATNSFKVFSLPKDRAKQNCFNLYIDGYFGL